MGPPIEVEREPTPTLGSVPEQPQGISTLSGSRPSRGVAGLLLALLAAIALGTWFTAAVDPEMGWMLELHRIKKAALQRAKSPRILLIGGSSVAFELDPSVIAAGVGQPTVNLGIAAGLGATTLLGYADRAAQPGDLLLLSLEPPLLDEGQPGGVFQPTALGRAFAALLRDPAMANGGSVRLGEWHFLNDGLATETLLAPSTPGLQRIATYGGRIVFNRPPLFRYSATGFDSNGYAFQKLMLAHPVKPQTPVLTDRWVAALDRFRRAQEARGVRVVYALPWLEVAPDAHARSLRATAAFLNRMNQVLPVVPDPGCGLISPDTGLFSDTEAHLTVEGATMRSRQLAEILTSGAVVPRGEGVTPDCGREPVRQ